MEKESARRLLLLPPEQITPNPDQPRTAFPEAELESLAESIRQNGVLQPILVRRGLHGYILIAGERRWRAARMAGLSAVPAILQEETPLEGAVLALIENLQRSDLNFFEEAAAIGALLRDHRMTQEEAARRLGMSQPALANKVRLLRLTEAERAEILQNRLTERHARALLRISDPAKRAAALREIIAKHLNVAETEALVQARLAPPNREKKPKRIFVAKDVRLFLNTFDRAVSVMKTAGIPAVAQKRETEDYFECVVRIPKLHSSTR